tara:strand:- start:184 stop:399 length:216 start_codon:yes stop_codon:yes gene_type:complete
MTNRAIDYREIPLQYDAEFLAHMNNAIESYEKPCDPAQPVICMDEQRSVEWRMKIDDAKYKLKSVYPKIDA